MGWGPSKIGHQVELKVKSKQIPDGKCLLKTLGGGRWCWLKQKRNLTNYRIGQQTQNISWLPLYFQYELEFYFDLKEFSRSCRLLVYFGLSSSSDKWCCSKIKFVTLGLRSLENTSSGLLSSTSLLSLTASVLALYYLCVASLLLLCCLSTALKCLSLLVVWCLASCLSASHLFQSFLPSPSKDLCLSHF